MTELRTERLLLRHWRDEDLPAFAAMNADPVVMKHFPKLLGRQESDALAELLRALLLQNGFGMWAVEIPGELPFAGFIGIVRVSFEAHFTPAVEIGWRLAAAAHHRGYATEGARAALRFGFDQMLFEEIVSMTVMANRPSWNVMEKLAMTRDPKDDFDHPRVPEGHALQRHILYRKKRALTSK